MNETVDVPPVCFFLPCEPDGFNRLPKSIEEYWVWQTRESGLVPYWGRYHWVLQTYLQLLAAGLPVSVVRELPQAGIVVSHVDCFDFGLRPGPGLYMVALLVDREVPHPHAQLHVTHNPVQTMPMGLDFAYMAPWPQVGLVPRSPARGDVFESLAFFGYSHNLHPELASLRFAERLSALGLSLTVPDPSQWHDFSKVDCVIAVRNFGRNRLHLNKPALKLYNAWLAGVPAVLGYETAYVFEGEPGLGYLEATSADETLAALQRLASDVELRHRLVAEGRQRALRLAAVQLQSQWAQLIQNRIVPGYRRWIRNGTRRLLHRAAGAVRERVLWRKPGWFGVAAS